MHAGSILPRLEWVRSYRRAALGRDVFAGIVLTAILIPAGMGYAEASGLPPIIGLYATILPLVAYALLGPSRILVLGPDSALLPIIAAAIVPLAAGDEARAVALAGLLAVLVGLIVIGAAIARLGFLTDLLSAPVRQGYLNGIALIIVVSQLPRLFGFSASGDSVLERGGAFVTGVRDGETNTVALAIGVACLVIILGLRYRWPRVPGILIAVVGSTIVSVVLDLAVRSGISVVGPLPVGLPPLSLPPLVPSDILAVAPAAFGIALVAATDTSILSRSFSSRRGEEVDQDRELLALGGANLADRALHRDARQQQRVTDTGRRGCRGADPDDLDRRGDRHRRGARCGAGHPRGPADVHPGRGRHRGRSVACRRRPPSRACGASGRPSSGSRWRASSAWRSSASSRASSSPSPCRSSPSSAVRGGPHDAVLGRADGVKGYHDLTYYPEARQIPGLAPVPVRCPAVLRQCRRLPRSGARAHRGGRGRRSAG